MSLAPDHDWYADLAARNYAMLPGFQHRQTEAGQEIFETLMPHIQKGALEIIVDLGCGSGEVLVDLARRLGDRRLNFGEAKPILLVGFDASARLIRKAEESFAKVRHTTDVRCLFVVCEDPSCQPFGQLKAFLERRGKPWESVSGRMAVLCLGHTIFHLLYLDTLFNQLEEDASGRPLMFIVDVYHSWDATIEELRTSNSGVVEEPRSFGMNDQGERVLNVLFTRRVATSGGTEVERGLIQARDIYTKGDTIIVTRQLARTSGELVAAFSKARYLLVQKVTSHSGYGEMNRFILQRSRRSFPLPALFLDTKAVPNLKRVAATGPATKTSPLHILARWMDESRFIESQPDSRTPKDGWGDGFDFAVVEITPWYYSPKGFSGLDIEFLICGPDGGSDSSNQEYSAQRTIAENIYKGKDQALGAAMAAYRDTLAKVQALRIGPFLHPNFAGYDLRNEWARAHFSYLENGSAESEFPATQRVVYRGWRDKIDRSVKTSQQEPTSADPIGDLRIRALIEKMPIDSLTSLAENISRDRKAYIDRMFDDHRPKLTGLRSINRLGWDTIAQDLDMVHAILHERLRKAFGLDEDNANIVRSVLIGIPLRIIDDQHPVGDKQLPERFRGGVWVFASTRGEFGPKQNALIGDLARFLVLLANTAIEAEAANEIEGLTAGAYKIVYEDPEIRNTLRTWNSARRRVDAHGFFGRDHHELSAWKKLIDAQTLPACAGRVQSESNAIIEGCIGRTLEGMDLLSRLIFLRGIVKAPNANYLSVDIVQRVLNPETGVEPSRMSAFGRPGFLLCNTGNYSCAGLLLYAIHLLRTHRPEEKPDGEPVGKLVSAKLNLPTMSGGKAELVFETEFIGADQRKKAKNALWATIKDREKRPGQKGNTACMLMRLASEGTDGEADADAEFVGGSNILRLTFRFPYSEVD